MTQPRRADTVVEKRLNWDHPVLYSLHWLQVQSRVQFKILTSVFKALNGPAPPVTFQSVQTLKTQLHQAKFF